MARRQLVIAPLVTRSNRYSFGALFGFLAPHLRSGPHTAAHDPCVVPCKSPDEIAAAAGSAGPGATVVVALSFCTPDIAATAGTIREIRRRVAPTAGPRVLLVAGGPHPSGDPASCLALGIDACVVGPGEIPFLKMLAALPDGLPLNGIPGLVTRDSLLPESGPEACLDDCFPAYPEARLFAPLEISRGCPQGCRFCQTSFLFGRRIRHRSLGSVARWLDDLIAREHRSCRFISPNAFGYGSRNFTRPSPEALEGILSLAAARVGRENVHFGSFPSEVWPQSVTAEAVRLVKRFAGNRRLVVGAQSGSQRVLDRLHRNHTVEDAERAVRTILSEGLTPSVDFIFGFPEETDEERRETVRFLRELVKAGARVHLHAFLPLAGTPLYDSEPSSIDPETRRALEQLTGTGAAFGQWRKQETQAKEIRRFLSRLRSGK